MDGGIVWRSVCVSGAYSSHLCPLRWRSERLRRRSAGLRNSHEPAAGAGHGSGAHEPSARQVRFLGACLEYARGVVELSVLRVLGEIGNMRNDDSVGMSGVGPAPHFIVTKERTDPA